MADVASYRAKTATFAAVALSPLLDATIDESGQASGLEADANPYSQATFVDGIAHTVDVTVTDVALIQNTALEIGDAGSLVVTYEKRADGRGAAGTSPNKIGTWANAVLISKRTQAGAGGNSNVVFSFRCAAVSGGSPVAWS